MTTQSVRSRLSIGRHCGRRQLLWRGIVALMMPIGAAGCTAPTYMSKERAAASGASASTSVVFDVSAQFAAAPPDCVAILPFDTVDQSGEFETAFRIEAASGPGGNEMVDDVDEVDWTERATARGDHETDLLEGSRDHALVSPDLPAQLRENAAQHVRRTIYSHFAPLSMRDVELAVVDATVRHYGDEPEKRPTIANAVNCEALMVGTVTDYGKEYFGIYSRVVVGADVKIIRARDGQVLWEARHRAQSHGGSVPLSPIGAIVGVYHAVANLGGEQLHRVADDLARRLVTTIPDIYNVDMAIAAGSEDFDAAGEQRMVTASSLRLRAGPGTNFPITGTLHRFATVEVVGPARRKIWLPVKTADGKTGFVSEKYVTDIEKVMDLPNDRADRDGDPDPSQRYAGN